MAGHWFESVADTLGPSYLRYSFTRGTEQEVTAIIDLLALEPGERVLDVGCGPGRHALGLAAAGMDVVGVDISETFVDLARDAAADAGLAARTRFVVADARHLDLSGEFDAVVSLCQGAFGLAGGPGSSPTLLEELDEPILAGMARALRPGGRLLLSAFSAYFQVRYLEERDSFDADVGVNHERTSLRDPEGVDHDAELWTTCFTPRELRLLARAVGLEPVAVHGATPGRYPTRDRVGTTGIDEPEFLLIARRSADSLLA